ncbi:MAG: hypothetical protein C0485_09325 [Pirellula sp.]|nr:hypothetical protein [Pirellula sp.]
MGRLFQWIQTAASTRGSLRRTATAAPRRRLAFERCESRIALSTADGDLVQFADGASFVAVDQNLAIEEGGSITLSFTAGDFVNWSAIKNRFDGIAVGSLADNFTIRSESMVPLLQGLSEGSARQLVGGWQYAFAADATLAGNGAMKDDAFDMFDSTAEGDYGMSLSGPELSSPSINSDLSVIPTPMPTPSEQAGGGSENEGGQIALTPFVAPTGLTLSNGYGSSSIARAKPTLEELRETPAARAGDSGRLEGLRGRAVVYEVADASGEAPPLHGQPDDRAIDDRDAVEMISLNELAPEGVQRHASRAAENSAAAVETIPPAESPNGGEAALVATSVHNLEAPGDLSLNGDAVESPTLNGGPIADRDEAFAGWPDTESLDSHSAALVAPQGDRDRRMLGIGLAVALSFIPFRKALQRRSSEQALQQELPRRRQVS